MRRVAPCWLNRTVAGTVAATFFCYAGHEISTAVLPLNLTAIGSGPEAPALIEGVADCFLNFAKLGGGAWGTWSARNGRGSRSDTS